MASLKTGTFKVKEGYMCRVNSAKPKRIIISFDGTGGEPGWAVQ
eukprot:CAMPEP_0171315352 /NCGR_PEP_ID=MMETSP0816-20121228/62880_1 /TAXON_ID=420281 /ORGANISM="Proboscia inermis, Strain CCAP1064/1" /LENGTH=43 /DNA_ID= /DNA_START= /DNA_END= /DNA_ORIENTATION=